MLGRYHHRGGADRHAIFISQGNLTFGIGTEAFGGAGAAGVGHVFQNAVGVVNWGRHQGVGFAAGVAKHDPLVAGAFGFVAAGVNPYGDIAGLLMQQDLDIGGLPMKTVLGVANVADCGACRLDHRVFGDTGRTAHFASQNHFIGGRQGFTGDAALRIGR